MRTWQQISRAHERGPHGSYNRGPQQPQLQQQFPALMSAGLIEATVPEINATEFGVFPALMSAGLIEASRLPGMLFHQWVISRAHERGPHGSPVKVDVGLAPNGFPALMSAGLIEAIGVVATSVTSLAISRAHERGPHGSVGAEVQVIGVDAYFPRSGARASLKQRKSSLRLLPVRYFPRSGARASLKPWRLNR